MLHYGLSVLLSVMKRLLDVQCKLYVHNRPWKLVQLFGSNDDVASGKYTLHLVISFVRTKINVFTKSVFIQFSPICFVHQCVRVCAPVNVFD